MQQEKARRTGEFLETQMLDVGSQLRDADARLADYERKHGVFTGIEQAGVAGMADLVATRLALQVRRTWLASYSNEDSPALKTHRRRDRGDRPERVAPAGAQAGRRAPVARRRESSGASTR